MSTENRNKVLLGFGALVAVVIVAIALWPANFRKEDASGAIGAVQKHRAPQITQKDVILGDENVRHQQKVLYADFLADATNLRAMAASHNYSAATELANELRTRYAAEADAEALMSRPVASISLAEEAAYLNAIQVEMKVAADAENLAVRQLADEQMASRLNAEAEQLEAKALSNIKANAETTSEMAARLNTIDDAIARASRQLGGIDWSGNRAILSKNLAAARQTLLSREADFYARSRAVANEELVAAKALNSAQLQNELANLQARLQARQQP